jgi:hypothetical protein
VLLNERNRVYSEVIQMRHGRCPHNLYGNIPREVQEIEKLIPLSSA